MRRGVRTRHSLHCGSGPWMGRLGVLLLPSADGQVLCATCFSARRPRTQWLERVSDHLLRTCDGKGWAISSRFWPYAPAPPPPDGRREAVQLVQLRPSLFDFVASPVRLGPRVVDRAQLLQSVGCYPRLRTSDATRRMRSGSAIMSISTTKSLTTVKAMTPCG
jgi:hypothetical protein